MPSYPLWVPVSDSAPTVQAAAAVTGPTAGTTITSITITTPGVYRVWNHLYLGGTSPGTADSANLQITKTTGATTTVLLSPLLVPPVANGSPEDFLIQVLCTTNDVLAVKAIANGTGTVIYNVTMVATLTNSNAL